ncbi:FxsA family protein [Neisseria chenwenguii]|uniref:Membrane protein FxsA n=1 Tax=Neisseria chenwenguii TaxID=1853278 RepID=A0A220RZZ7_9NEIS|nr:FxsA family protein [Neisseria chenwenguii]ASK26722.1 membrane protein FxsA [Neisseria chenwenguii]ROV56384.1 FxsA family protein [Neisseria chenwenguii]
MQFFGIGFLVLLFFEILSIVRVADWLGGGWTFVLMVLSFFGGLAMLRHTGLSGILLAGAAMRSGREISLYQMLWPIRYAVAALMLMSPGFISTALALVLLLPFKGKPVAQMNPENIFTHTQNPFARNMRRDNEDIIEGEYTVTRTDADIKKQDYIEHKPD